MYRVNSTDSAYKALYEYKFQVLYNISFSPDSKRLLLIDYDGGHLYDVESGKEGYFLPGPIHENDADWARFSPDGQRVLSRGRGTNAQGETSWNVSIWDVPTGTRIHTFPNAYSGAFSRDNNYIVLRESDGFSVWRYSDFGFLYKLEYGSPDIVELSRNGYFAYSRYGPSTDIWDIRKRLKITIPTEGGLIVFPYNAEIVFVQRFEHYAIWDFSGDTPSETVFNTEEPIVDFASSTGRLGAILVSDGTIKIVDLLRHIVLRTFCSPNS